MQTVIVNCEAQSYVRCVSCGCNTRKCERYLQVYTTNKNGEWKKEKGERYCVHCEKYARLNNDVTEDEIFRNNPPPDIRDDEARLRLREEYAAYRASGCTDKFWSDRDAGYIR